MTQSRTIIVLSAKPPAILLLYLVVACAYWLYTGITTSLLDNWLAESSLFVSTLVLLIAFHRHFQFSLAAYTCFFLFLLLHLHGAHYSYPEAPVGYWLQQISGSDRNSFDRVAHFSFGLLLFLPMKELAGRLLRLPSVMQWWWPLELTLALSVLFELVEWLVAVVVFPSLGTSYLGYQGDLWDAHKDVGLALCGAVLALVFCRYFGSYLTPTENVV